jgi:tRNA-specific 2-thiouridylase
MQVRQMANDLGFATAEKPDSQDICFVRDRNKNGFLRKELAAQEEPGPIVDAQGAVLGTHHGLLGYTIGQREGLGLSVGRPLYILAMDRPTNRLVVGSKEELLAATCIAERVNWVSIESPTAPVQARVKIRSRHEPAAAMLTPRADGGVLIAFDEPQSAITPGQAAVFYDGDTVLGGGWISPPSAGVNGER